MSGPQGSDPTQPWPGSQPPSDPPAPAWQQPPAPDQPTTEVPAWGQQPPAYTPPQQYPGYQQPAQPGYPPPGQYPGGDQYGQQPTAYGPTSYPQSAPPQYGQPTQYGQPPQPGQYGQQYSPYQQAADAQQFSPYSATGTEAGSKKSLGIILGVVGVLVAVAVIAVGILGFWKPGWWVETQLDVNAAQSGVTQILSDEANGYGAKNVEDVKCNDGKNPTVEKGGNFTCEVSIDGTKREVTVTFQDNDGTYEVGRPK
jgi:hypothetical protein